MLPICYNSFIESARFRALPTMPVPTAVLSTPSVSSRPIQSPSCKKVTHQNPQNSLFAFNRLRTLPSSVSCNPLVCHSCEKCRVSLALSSLLPLFAQRMIHNSFPFKRLRTLSKNSRVYPNSSYFGTRFLTNQEIGFPPPHPIKSPRCPYPVRKWTGQSRNRYE